MEINPEEEAAFLSKRTGCTADEAWNYIIAGDRFFDEAPDCGEEVLGEKLAAYICEASGMGDRLVQKLMDAEAEFFGSKGML